MLLDQLAPPIAKKIIRNLLKPVKVYDDFNSANQAVKNLGYDDDTLIDIIFLKTKRFIEEIIQNPSRPLEVHNLFLLSIVGIINQKQKLKVLDFGGAFGTHYFIAKAFFAHLDFEWTVVELPQVIERGRQFENAELKFLDIEGNFDKTVGDFDLVLTSGTLQHMPEPEKTLAFLCRHNAPYLALLRLGVNLTQKDVWIIHKARFQDCGPGPMPANHTDGIAAFPFCLMSMDKISKALYNHRLILSNNDASGTMSVPGYPIQGFNQLYTLPR